MVRENLGVCSRVAQRLQGGYSRKVVFREVEIKFKFETPLIREVI